jgi:hypothetical protein
MKYSAKSLFIKIFLVLLLILCLLMPLGCGKKGPPVPLNIKNGNGLGRLQEIIYPYSIGFLFVFKA